MPSVFDVIQEDVEEFARLLLDNDQGISEDAYKQLCVLAGRFRSKKLGALTRATKATDGRYYLPKS